MKVSISLSLDRKTVKRLESMSVITGMTPEVMASGIVERAIGALVEVQVQKTAPVLPVPTRVNVRIAPKIRQSKFDMRGTTVSAQLGRKILEVLEASSTSLTMSEVCHVGEIDPSHISYIKEILIREGFINKDGTGPSFHNRSISDKWRLAHLGKKFIQGWLTRK